MRDPYLQELIRSRQREREQKAEIVRLRKQVKKLDKLLKACWRLREQDAADKERKEDNGEHA